MDAEDVDTLTALVIASVKNRWGTQRTTDRAHLCQPADVLLV